ncbi:hypothetical protein CYMTET_28388 [Cymbomonas tetramitiformis]|uniref:Uncharacterized protein n=1 Tax=Cymbomonas tetramitiformis TaxID=36881 RepID=A0AAE0KW84_9CHLO|nr:hypothetical protein CYMTET_28388 [Cymbomonas tetramitiformis]
MVVRGTLPGSKAQQNGQSGVFFWAHCHAIMMKNEGTGYRRDLCARLGIDPPESMYALDERLQRQKERAAALRVTQPVKRKRKVVRDAKSARNDPIEERFGYATQEVSRVSFSGPINTYRYTRYRPSARLGSLGPHSSCTKGLAMAAMGGKEKRKKFSGLLNKFSETRIKVTQRLDSHANFKGDSDHISGVENQNHPAKGAASNSRYGDMDVMMPTLSLSANINDLPASQKRGQAFLSVLHQAQARRFPSTTSSVEEATPDEAETKEKVEQSAVPAPPKVPLTSETGALVPVAAAKKMLDPLEELKSRLLNFYPKGVEVKELLTHLKLPGAAGRKPNWMTNLQNHIAGDLQRLNARDKRICTPTFRVLLPDFRVNLPPMRPGQPLPFGQQMQRAAIQALQGLHADVAGSVRGGRLVLKNAGDLVKKSSLPLALQPVTDSLAVTKAAVTKPRASANALLGAAATQVRHQVHRLQAGAQSAGQAAGAGGTRVQPKAAQVQQEKPRFLLGKPHSEQAKPGSKVREEKGGPASGILGHLAAAAVQRVMPPEKLASGKPEGIAGAGQAIAHVAETKVMGGMSSVLGTARDQVKLVSSGACALKDLTKGTLNSIVGGAVGRASVGPATSDVGAASSVAAPGPGAASGWRTKLMGSVAGNAREAMAAVGSQVLRTMEGGRQLTSAAAPAAAHGGLDASQLSQAVSITEAPKRPWSGAAAAPAKVSADAAKLGAGGAAMPAMLNVGAHAKVRLCFLLCVCIASVSRVPGSAGVLRRELGSPSLSLGPSRPSHPHVPCSGSACHGTQLRSLRFPHRFIPV